MVVKLPAISGKAGIGTVLDVMRQPAYLKLLGKSVTIATGAGLLARKVPALAIPAALTAGIYIGLEMAAWMEEEAKRHDGPVIDVVVVEPAGVAPIMAQFADARGPSQAAVIDADPPVPGQDD